jgi:hypothetical protein
MKLKGTKAMNNSNSKYGMLPDPGFCGTGTMKGLFDLIIEAAVTLVVLAVRAVFWSLRELSAYVFVSPALGWAWTRYVWKHRADRGVLKCWWMNRHKAPPRGAPPVLSLVKQ